MEHHRSEDLFPPGSISNIAFSEPLASNDQLLNIDILFHQHRQHGDGSQKHGNRAIDFVGTANTKNNISGRGQNREDDGLTLTEPFPSRLLTMVRLAWLILQETQQTIRAGVQKRGDK